MKHTHTNTQQADQDTSQHGTSQHEASQHEVYQHDEEGSSSQGMDSYGFGSHFLASHNEMGSSRILSSQYEAHSPALHEQGDGQGSQQEQQQQAQAPPVVSVEDVSDFFSGGISLTNTHATTHQQQQQQQQPEQQIISAHVVPLHIQGGVPPSPDHTFSLGTLAAPSMHSTATQQQSLIDVQSPEAQQVCVSLTVVQKLHHYDNGITHIYI